MPYTSFGLPDRTFDNTLYRQSSHTSHHSISGEDSNNGLFSTMSNGSTSNRTSRQSFNLDEIRANLTRRNTTNAVQSGLPPIGQQRWPATDMSTDFAFPVAGRENQALEKKQAEYEYVKKKKEQFLMQMAALDLEEQRLRSDLNGHQSEPTTPPELKDSGFPTPLSRPNRFSSSGIISPPSLSRKGRAGSQAMSPSERDRALQALNGLPGSVPVSRRESDEEDDQYQDEVLNLDHRLNRNSMPLPRRDNNLSMLDTGLDGVNTTAFLFGDEYKQANGTKSPPFLQMHTNESNFPVLVRHNGEKSLSAASEALDLASTHEETNGGWPVFARQGNSPNMASPDSQNLPPPHSAGAIPSKPVNRHSMGARIGTFPETKRPSLYTAMPSSVPVRSGPSFSTSSVPTMNSLASGTPTSPEQRLHNHNLSLGRIPNSASRQSRDLTPASPESAKTEDKSIAAAVQANGYTSPPTSFSPEQTMPQLAVPPGYFTPFVPSSQLQAISAAIDRFQISSYQHVMPAQTAYMADPRFNYAYSGKTNDRSRRTGYEDASRFLNVELDRMQGEIYGLCRDQHGCRYLQKKLEERKPENIEMIFSETNEHMVELMTDPFGNYLCQKLLEFANEEQRTTLINNAAPEMVSIALNQHGTRALQKMIEYVTTPTQIDVVIIALRHHVVQMIQDLNGNHVIQKCLNRLTSKDAQFIFDAVAKHCVTVGTHRHGCCVIQRCIDHAADQQKVQLVAAITGHSMELVQDPYGNYVIQYIHDIGESAFSEPLCKTFVGNMVRLSKHKFSSNVVEKSIRVASAETRHVMIRELLDSPDFDKVIDDPFANYVVQTALDYANVEDEALLVDKIRPILARIRQKPYARRFQTKVAERDKKLGIVNSGTVTPNEMSSPESSAMSSPFRSDVPQTNGTPYNNSFTPAYYQAPFGYAPPHRLSNPPYPNLTQVAFQPGMAQPFIPYNRPQNGAQFY